MGRDLFGRSPLRRRRAISSPGYFFNASFRSSPSVGQLTHLRDDVLSDPTKNIYPFKG
jgi:hypothetical protein